MSLTLPLGLAVIVLAFANGANDNFKGVATLHGTGALGFRGALAWATLTTLAGSLCGLMTSALLLRRFTGAGLVGPETASDPAFLGAAATGAAATILLATRLGLPVSTTHALMGGLLGAGMVHVGPAGLGYATLATAMALPLAASPLLAGVLTMGLDRAAGLTKRWGPTRDGCVCADLEPALAPVEGLVGPVRVPSIRVGSRQACEEEGRRGLIFWRIPGLTEPLHVLSAGAVGFARGLNDTPKIAALIVGAGLVQAPAALVRIALAMGVGGLLAAGRVARTLSFRITTLEGPPALAANLVTAALVILASPLGLPVSTTYVSCGAILGAGALRGSAHWATAGRLAAAWATTLPLAAVLAALVAVAMQPPIR